MRAWVGKAGAAKIIAASISTFLLRQVLLKEILAGGVKKSSDFLCLLEISFLLNSRTIEKKPQGKKNWM